MSNCLLQRGFKTPAHSHGNKHRMTLSARCSSQRQQSLTGSHLDRRDVLLASIGLAVASAVTPAGAAKTAVQASKFLNFQDSKLAYQFQYPTQTSSGVPLTLRLARGPSTYSSAPILTPDGRQRIVSQLMDLTKNVTITLTVGPAAGTLKEKAPSEWGASEVAITVLVDRSTARVSSGQRIALNDVEEVRVEEREGSPYWVYEHVSQGSPTITNPERDNYRHAVAATTFRHGESGHPFLYTLNLSCPQQMWADLEPLFFSAVDSFRLLTPTKDYVAPDSGFSLF